LWLISLAGFASMACMRVCDPMLVFLAQEFAVSVGEASQVISAFAVAYGALQLFYGPLGDRVGKLRVINAALLACALLCALTAMAGDFELLVLARAGLGASAAGIIPLCLAWLGDQVGYEHRQETLAKLMSATVAGMMAGQWFGGWVAESLGWRIAFAVLAGLFALVCVLMFVRMGALRRAVPLRTEGSYLQQAWESLRLLRLPRVRWVLGVTAIEGALVFGALAFVPSLLVQRLQLSAAWAGGLMALYGVGGLLYSQLARRWLGWFGERGLARLGSTLVATGLLLLAWTPGVWWAALGCLASGLGFYMLHNTLQTQATQMAPQARGSAMTLFAGFLFYGQSTGVLLLAQTVDGRGLSWAYTAAALGMVLLGAEVARQVKAKV
jgi:predicted MFS family arabinose efflux permease